MKFIAFILLVSLLCGCVKKRDEEVSLIIGKIIVIDPGHGGLDNGASYNNVLEDELNLAVSLMLQEKLLDDGVFAIITRNADYDLAGMYDKNRKNRDLRNRVKIIEDYKADIFISLHMNVYGSSNVKGAQVFYQGNNKDSREFARVVQEELNKLQTKQRKEMMGKYYILDNTSRTGILVEMGFLTSPEDVEKINKKEYKIMICNTIINSIKIYFDEIN